MGLTVLIVGGSVSGLSLASMLEQFGIDYIVLEGHATIAPQLGASLGLLPSGLRILDQLGVYDKIRAIVGDMYYTSRVRLFSGRSWIDKKPTTISEELEDRIGYPQTFIDRKIVLELLFNSLKHKDRVLTGKRVQCVKHGKDSVTVTTRDGSEYTGDILIGADGVHSTIRQQMWQIAGEAKSDVFQPDPLNELQCESKCVFGISDRPPGLPTSPHQINAFFKNCNYMVISAPRDRYYWFLFTEVEKVYGKNIAKYTKDDELKLAEEHYKDQLTETVTFEDLYARRTQTTLVSLEDHVFPRWHYRRILTIGDAAHKVHPISAQGGNGALETAAVLVNTLVPALEGKNSDQPLTESDIDAIFSKVQAKRYKRSLDAVKQGRLTNSASIKETFLSRMFVDYFFPLFGHSMVFSLIVQNTTSGPCIAGLPVPKRYANAIERHDRRTSAKKGWISWSVVSMGAACFLALVYTELNHGGRVMHGISGTMASELLRSLKADVS